VTLASSSCTQSLWRRWNKEGFHVPSQLWLYNSDVADLPFNRLHSTTFTILKHCLQTLCPSNVSSKDQLMRYQANRQLWLQSYITLFAQFLFSIMKIYMCRLILRENSHKIIRFYKTKPNLMYWWYFPEAIIIYANHSGRAVWGMNYLRSLIGSNPAQDMDVCIMCIYCVCVVLCVGSGLPTGWSPVKGVLPAVYRVKKLRKQSRPNKGL
jgi:hypothetical protein